MSLWLGTLGASGLISGSSFESVSSVSVSSNTFSISFNSIPSTYRHLQLRALVRSATTESGGAGYFWRLSINTATNPIYATYLTASQGGIAAGSGAEYWAGTAPRINTSTSDSPLGAAIIDIIDFSTNNKKIVMRSFSGYDNALRPTPVSNVGILSTTQSTTATPTGLTVSDGAGAGFGPGSQFSLYGIRA